MSAITKLQASKADSGYCGQPGSWQAEYTCAIYATPRGWIAEGEVKTGGNQGYFQVDYSHGPWVARGDTPRQAVQRMKVPVEWRAVIDCASEQALAEVGDQSWSSLLRAERARLADLVVSGDRGGRRCRIGCDVYWADSADERRALRQRGIAAIDRALARHQAPLPLASDDDILAAAIARGLIADTTRRAA